MCHVTVLRLRVIFCKYQLSLNISLASFLLSLSLFPPVPFLPSFLELLYLFLCSSIFVNFSYLLYMSSYFFVLFPTSCSFYVFSQSSPFFYVIAFLHSHDGEENKRAQNSTPVLNFECTIYKQNMLTESRLPA